MTTTPMYQLSKTIEMRWANPENYEGARHAGGKTNHGRKGSPCRGEIQPGETWVLAQDKGCGTVRKFWITMTDRGLEMLRGLVLRMYWDGAKTPAVEVPLGDFFCNPLGREFVFENEWFNNPEARNWNCHLPMPFRKSFKITVTNETPIGNKMFWYHIDYTLGDAHNEDTGYFHAYWNRENPTTLRRDFLMLPEIKGRGRYLGATLGLITSPCYRCWWGEGEVKIYLDGDKQHPTLCGTGTEDYICTAWGTGSYSTRWYGCQFLSSPYADREQIAMYRLHGSDPIYFQKSLRIELQQIGFWNGMESATALAVYGGKGITLTGDGTEHCSLEALSKNPPISLFERQDDWCSTVFFYLDKPNNSLPPLADYKSRIHDLTGAPDEAMFAIADAETALTILPANSEIETRLRSIPAALFQGVASRINQELSRVPDIANRLKAHRTEKHAQKMDQLLQDLKTTGLLATAYKKKIDAVQKRIQKTIKQPTILSCFEASILLQRPKKISECPVPGASVKFSPLPYVIESELADIREVSDSRDGLVYIRTTVEMEKSVDAILAYGADGPVKVWINGTAVDCQPSATNPAKIEEYQINHQWKKGRNSILFALFTNQGKAWGIVARILQND